MAAGQLTWREIMSQPAAWRAALAAYAERARSAWSDWMVRDFDKVIVTGCGSTYYLSLCIAHLLRRSGVDAIAAPASQLWLDTRAYCRPGRRNILLAFSRSGSTSETLRAVSAFSETDSGGIFVVTCDSDSPLARMADWGIHIDAAQEISVAQTRSFSSMAVVGQLLARHDAADDPACQDLPAACENLLAEYGEMARRLGEAGNLRKFFFLGAGPLYGIACEAMLKMKEMSLAYSEAYHTLEFRHGPMSMVGADSLVVGLVSPGMTAPELQVLRDMQDLGATALAIGATPSEFANQVMLPANLPAWIMPALYLPVLQLLAWRRARFNGQDPDQPHQLSAVIELED